MSSEKHCGPGTDTLAHRIPAATLLWKSTSTRKGAGRFSQRSAKPIRHRHSPSWLPASMSSSRAASAEGGARGSMSATEEKTRSTRLDDPCPAAGSSGAPAASRSSLTLSAASTLTRRS